MSGRFLRGTIRRAAESGYEYHTSTFGNLRPVRAVVWHLRNKKAGTQAGLANGRLRCRYARTRAPLRGGGTRSVLHHRADVAPDAGPFLFDEGAQLVDVGPDFLGQGSQLLRRRVLTLGLDVLRQLHGVDG